MRQKNVFKHLASVLTVLCMLFCSLQTSAQLPSTVDIGLYETTPGTLEVRMKPNGASFSEVVSGIVFTIRYETASGVTLGAVNQQFGATPGAGWCPLLVSQVVVNPAGVVTDGIYSYQNYTEFGLSQLSSCAFSPGYSWPMGTEIVLCEIPYSGQSGCVNFDIADDAFAGTQNYEYFISLNGFDVTGVIGSQTVSVNCGSLDCEGVQGGTALPGTACDDMDATTGNDVYDANCNCAGQLIDCEGVIGGPALPGTPCDDMDATTGNDVYDTNCNCAGQLIDCEGVIGGPALPGTMCDDMDATTGNDTYDANCNCAGQLIDCAGVPNGALLPGTTCDDMDATTGNDVYDANCNCAGQPIDCEGVIGGPALPGTMCDDMDPNTSGDVYQPDCSCQGAAVDCLGIPGGTAVPGSPCDDMDATTGNDVYQPDCTCQGQVLDCLGVPGGSALPGSGCNDGDATTGNDVYDANCNCSGQLIDCEGVAGGTALPGSSCDDMDPNTTDDEYQPDCTCMGTVSNVDCEGVAGGSALPGTSCDDMDATTGNDTYDSNCNCVGQLIDCEGTVGGSALPGTACDDMDPATNGDVYDANCNCAGSTVDCEGVAGGSALPGTSCDDMDATTGNDTYDANCNCVGQLIDCEGTAGGTALPGTACDDMDPATSGDVYDANCNCAGSAVDCEGVAGGTALPGTSCDDMDVTTGNDTYDANCNCVGQLIDCEGTAGGTALPGTACDDMDPNTSGDVYDANCNCAGSATGGCTGTEVTLEVQTDNNGNETTWEILVAGSSTAVCSGGPYANNSLITENCCLVTGCYELRVFDSMGDGMYAGATGGYKLTVTASGSRIIDNSQDGQFGALSAMDNNSAFCVPIGNDRLAHWYCDRLDYDVNDMIVVAPNPAVHNEFGVGDQTDDGFKYWIFNPDGGFNRRIFMSHANPSIGAPPGAWAVSHLNLLNLNSVLPVPQMVKLNVRVQSRVNGVSSEYGPACVFMVDPIAANDPCNETTLIFDPASQYFSCGASFQFGQSDYITAFPVPGANKYKFTFDDGQGFVRNITSSTYHLWLNWATNPLTAGTTYSVTVRASLDNGVTYCPVGGACSVSIVAPAATAATNRLLEAKGEMKLFPNPTLDGLVNVELTNFDLDATSGALRVLDLYGKQLIAEQVIVQNGSVLTQIQLDKRFAQGVYIVHVNVNGEGRTMRLIKK